MADFALALGSAAAVERWLAECGAAEIWQADGLGLAIWPGAAAATAASPAAIWAPDGRAVGAFSGVLLSDSAVQERLALRGLALAVADHCRLTVIDAALHGPAAVAAWRWQGSLACLNPGQRQAILVRDPLGVGWLGWQRLGELQLWSNRLELAQHWRAVPPGIALLVAGGKVAAQALRLQGVAAPYLRELPTSLPTSAGSAADRQALLAAGLRERLRSAVTACVRGAGALALLDQPAGLARLWPGECEDLLTPAPALPAGAAAWTLQGAAEQLGAPLGSGPAAGLAAGDPSPWPPEVFEPTERCEPLDRAERLWRAQELPQLLHADRQRAAHHGWVLAAPHLDPAVLAWLGGFARSDREVWAAARAAP